MKKRIMSALLALCLLCTLLPLSAVGAEARTTERMRVALVTDYGDITDESFNQATYEGAREWCEANGVGFTYYKPTGDSTAERVAAIDQAVADGYNVLLMPGFAFADAIVETVENYPDVKFIALDVSEWDLQDAHGTSGDFSWVYPANLYSAVYQEELAGYMAGFAAVKLGYTKLGFLGGMAVPAVDRYGYGFVQGCNDAAKELGNTADIELKYVYGNQFYGDADITAYMDSWYAAGTEIVFACGGGIYASAAEAAQKVHGKVIGVDVDQAPTIDHQYGKGMTVTSAMKGLAATAKMLLGRIAEGTFEGGIVETLGLVSEKPEENFVQLPDSTQWNEGFTQDDYAALVADLLHGRRTVTSNTEYAPEVSIRVDYQGNIPAEDHPWWDPDPWYGPTEFEDVPYGAFYADAVAWAVDHEPQITSGTGGGKFSPDMTCSRAQVVTFLWRAMGCPAPKSSEIPFSDVPAGQWYTDAVLWAVEKEITGGTGGGKFSPDAPCTRAQVVTFLWRAHEKPAPKSGTIPFGDVPAGQWYTDAVLWAVENEITGGTGGGKFSPDMECSRGQIVTFLYRDLA